MNNMKFSVLLLPVLASGITALYVPDKLVQAFLKDSSEGNCCNETPCFIGCPVDGVFRVGYPFLVFTIQSPRTSCTLAQLEFEKSGILTSRLDEIALLLRNTLAKMNGGRQGPRRGRCMEFFYGSLSSADQTHWGEGGKGIEGD